MGIGVGGALISFFSADTFNEKKEEQVKEIIGELKRLLRSTTSLREPKKRSVQWPHSIETAIVLLQRIEISHVSARRRH